MVHYTDPMSWPTPSWHQDYGDVQGELNHLRNLAIVLVEQNPRVSVGLSVPEPGLMYLVVTDESNRALSEIYSVQRKGHNREREYALFLFPNSNSERELYVLSTTDVVELLRRADLENPL
jgi:hypothetical protein